MPLVQNFLIETQYIYKKYVSLQPSFDQNLTEGCPNTFSTEGRVAHPVPTATRKYLSQSLYYSLYY